MSERPRNDIEEHTQKDPPQTRFGGFCAWVFLRFPSLSFSFPLRSIRGRYIKKALEGNKPRSNRRDTMTNGLNIKTGDTFRGLYMGYPFAGVVTCIEGNASGYAIDANSVRVFIDNDSAIGSDIDGWNRREANDGIIMDCAAVGGGRLVREDSRFTDVTMQRTT